MFKEKTNISTILPYLTAFFLFAGVSVIYFAPQFSGKELRTNDIIQNIGGSKDIRDHQALSGEDPQWTGSMFGGMPAQLHYMEYDSMILKSVQKKLDFLGRPASWIFLAMSGFFIMLLIFGVNPWVGIIPSLAYGLSTYFFLIIGAGHVTKMITLAYAPLMVGGVAFAYRKNMWIGAVLTALFGSLQLSANHPQITYYFIFILFAYWINEGIKSFREKTLPRFAKVTGLLLLAGVLAVGSNLAPLWYINEYGKYSTRGGSELKEDLAENKTIKNSQGLELDYATAWSYGKMESFNMFIPNLMGGSSEGNFSDDGKVAEALTRYGARSIATQLPSYWGAQPSTGGPTYIGAVIIYLCVLGLFLLRGRCKWWIVIVTAIAVFLAWGKNFLWFTELFFNYFPGYSKFRTVAMILVIAEWSVPFIAALILNKIWKSEISKETLVTAIKRSFYVTGGVAMFFLLLGGMLFDFSASYDFQMGLPEDVVAAMRGERLSMLRMDSFRSLLFVFLTAATVYLFAIEKLKKGWFIVVLSVLVCADLIPVNLRFLPHSRFVDKMRTEIRPTEADLKILQDTTLGYRVLNLSVSPFNDATTSYFHRSVGGYHGAKMRRYQDIIDRHLSRNNWEVYNMLNTKYIISPDRESGELDVQYNNDANGAAWFVNRIIVADNPDQEISLLNDIDTKTEAVVDKKFLDDTSRLDFDIDTSAYIYMTEYAPNYLKYRYGTEYPALGIFSEIYYDKGWVAYIDGNEVPYFRADYILRGIQLPAGEHVVEFRYRAENFKIVSGITLIFSILIILCLIAAIAGWLLYNRKKI